MNAPHTYTAQLRWQRAEGEPFVDNRYSRRHEWRFDGGVVVPGSSSPLHVRLPYSDASCVDPEEALVAAASSCHLLSFLYLAAKAGLRIDAYEDDAEGLMGRNEQGREAIVRITLRPRVQVGGGVSAEQLAQLHHEAHEICFIANSLKSEIVCEPRIVGAA